jgi:hypothetical protein
MTTMYVAKGVRASMQNTSKHLILLRDLGLIEQRMGRLYEIPQAFIVPGERALDYGPMVLRFGEQK